MANGVNVIPKSDSERLREVGELYPYRAVVKHRLYSVATTYATIFTAANFPGRGLDIVEQSASLANPGENAFNNLVSRDKKPRFPFMPEFMGFHISDPGDERVRSILVENARVELLVNDDRIVNLPLLALPPGLDVERRTVTTASDTTKHDERHAPAANIGIFRFKQGTKWTPSDEIKGKLYVEEAALTALAALAGSCPAQGFSIGFLFYGQSFGAAGTGV